MTIETVEVALFQRLDTYTKLDSLVASRIYPMVAPQNVDTPFLTYERSSTQRVSNLSSDTDVAQSIFQVSVWSFNKDEAVEVAEQVRAALQRWQGTQGNITILDSYLQNQVDLYDGNTALFQITFDFEIWHRE